MKFRVIRQRFDGGYSSNVKFMAERDVALPGESKKSPTDYTRGVPGKVYGYADNPGLGDKTGGSFSKESRYHF